MCSHPLRTVDGVLLEGWDLVAALVDLEELGDVPHCPGQHVQHTVPGNHSLVT